MKTLIISAGLMGGSIAKALALAGWEVHATARKQLQYDGIQFYTNFSQLPQTHFDVICICSPRGRNYEIYNEMFEKTNGLSHSHIVDISSVQNRNNLHQLKYPSFVPCHPIAGSEKTGFENSSAEILKGKKCLVIKHNPPKVVIDFWQACGMIVDSSITSCMEHDRIFAKVSHLPQLISFCLPDEKKPEYKEFYRLKKSSRQIWDEIFLHNKDWIFEALMEFAIKDSQILHNEIFTNFKQIIGRVFTEITTKQEMQYAGAGFKTITSELHNTTHHFNRDNINEHCNKVSEHTQILDNAATMLSSLVLQFPEMKV